MFSIFLGLIVIVALLLVLVIMVQNPKGGGLSSSFGAGGGSQLGGVQKTTDFLDKSTWILATLLLALILLSNVSIMDGQGLGESKVINEDTVIENATPVEVPAPAATEEKEAE